MATAITPTVFGSDLAPKSGWLVQWEKQRHAKYHWVAEVFAEMLGVFIFVYAGVGATAAFVVGSLSEQAGVGSILQIGFGYAMGIMLAIVICASTSGGHFSPCVTIAHVLFKGLPPLKAVRYICAQILGGYFACLVIYVQYRHQIAELDAALAAKGLLESTKFTPQGTGGIFGMYAPPGSNLGFVFLNEFVCDTLLGLAIWAATDHTNFLAPPSAAPWIVGLAYAVVIWGFAPVGIAANSSRDLGGRLMVLTIWGRKAAGGNYAAIAALTNIPAMILGVVLYEVFLADSARVLPAAHVDFVLGHAHHMRVLGAQSDKLYGQNLPVISRIEGEKGRSEMYEYSRYSSSNRPSSSV